LNLKTEDKEKGFTHEKIMAVMGKTAVVGVADTVTGKRCSGRKAWSVSKPAGF